MKMAGEISINNVKEYIWAKYIENEPDLDCPLSDEEMLAVMDEYYASSPPESDPEIFYYGVLLFEMAYEVADEAKQEEFFIRAKRMLEMYRTTSGEQDWDAVEDRLEDIDSTLSSKGITPEMIRAVQEADAGAGAARIEEMKKDTPRGMALVPGGNCPGGEEDAERHIEPFFMDLYPVTNKDYLEFIKATGYRPPKYAEDKELSDLDKPVVGVSYFDAVQYATWAGKTLPNVDQWMMAAGGGDERRFPWGNDFDNDRVHFGSHDNGAVEKVGSRVGNTSPSGVFDLVGNVWEWTSSWFEEKEEYKVIKGGSWCDPSDYLQLDTENYASPKEKIDIIGFRCCIIP